MHKALLSVSFSGTIDPVMGTASTLSSTLFGRTRGAVLAVLFGHVGESYYLRQLARMTGITLGPVQRELRQLVDAGLVTKKTLGTQTLFSANEASPIFAEMRAIVAKTVGIRDILLAALSPLAANIDLAFVYGSVARSREGQQSDVDLMIVGSVRFEDVVDRIAYAQKTLNREINPTVYTANEFRGKLRGNFLKTVLGENKLFLIGDEDVLRKLGQ
jgi:predicted nucleotidyltransferase